MGLVSAINLSLSRQPELCDRLKIYRPEVGSRLEIGYSPICCQLQAGSKSCFDLHIYQMIKAIYVQKHLLKERYTLSLCILFPALFL